MATDGDFDYRHLTRIQLLEAAQTIDASRYPLNASNLRRALESKGMTSSDVADYRPVPWGLSGDHAVLYPYIRFHAIATQAILLLAPIAGVILFSGEWVPPSIPRSAIGRLALAALLVASLVLLNLIVCRFWCIRCPSCGRQSMRCTPFSAAPFQHRCGQCQAEAANGWMGLFYDA